MSFQRDARTVVVDGNVHAQQTGHELTAAKMTLELNAAFQAKRVVASGQPQLHDLNPQGPIALSAEEIASNLRPDGSIESIVAAGSVHGARNTPVSGDGIDAGRIQLDLTSADNVPRLLTASSGVVLTSTSASFNGGTRRVETDALEVHFSSDSRPGQTLLDAMNTLAPARIDWQNEAIVGSKHIPQLTQMSGKQMNLKFDEQNQLQQLVSSGGVEVARKLGDAPEQVTASRELTAKFDKAGEWTTINQMGNVQFHDGQRTGQGNSARLDRTLNTVNLDGSVVFSDAATRTTAQSASFSQPTNTVHADGHVMTTELRPATAGISNFAQEPAHVTAEHLVADTAHGHAVYTGKGRMWQGQSVIEGDTIELDSPTHTLVAKNNVRGVFPQVAWSPKPGQAEGSALNQIPKPVSNKVPSQPAHAATQLGHFRGGLLTYW
jgi:lipopolysaccharide export system protein LptA